MNHSALERMTEEKMREQNQCNGKGADPGGAVDGIDKNTVKDSACCVVS